MAARRWVTPDDVAQEMGVSAKTVVRAIRAGALKAKRLGRRYLIAPADLEAYYAALPDGAVDQASVIPSQAAPSNLTGRRPRRIDFVSIERERRAREAAAAR